VRARLVRAAVERERKARRAREAAEKRTEHPEPEDEAPAS
jgi:hypothetical protein